MGCATLTSCRSRSRLGASNKVLQLVATGTCVPLVSTALSFEYEAMLSRPEHRLATHMSEEDVHGFLSALASAAEGVVLNFFWRPQLADPADEMVLEVAVNGRAEAIVTHTPASNGCSEYAR